MVAEFAMQGLSALTNAISIMNTIKDVSDRTALNTAISGVTQNLIEAQSAAIESQRQESTLVQRIRELEDKVSRLEDWNTEKQRYQLEEIPPGFLVYAIKEEARGGQPDHKICAACYQKREISFLHKDAPINGRTDWRCHACGFEARSGTFVPPKINRGPRGGPGSWMRSPSR